MNKFLLLLIFISSFHFSSAFLNQYQNPNKYQYSLLKPYTHIGAFPCFKAKKAKVNDKFLEYETDGMFLYMVYLYLLFCVVA